MSKSKLPITRKWGARLLGVWLLLTGLSPILRLSWLAEHNVLAIVAILAGVAILLDW